MCLDLVFGEAVFCAGTTEATCFFRIDAVTPRKNDTNVGGSSLTDDSTCFLS